MINCYKGANTFGLAANWAEVAQKGELAFGCTRVCDAESGEFFLLGNSLAMGAHFLDRLDGAASAS